MEVPGACLTTRPLMICIPSFRMPVSQKPALQGEAPHIVNMRIKPNPVSPDQYSQYPLPVWISLHKPDRSRPMAKSKQSNVQAG